MIPNNILAILQCPKCRSQLTKRSEDALVCSNCHETFCVKGNVPMMVAASRPNGDSEPTESSENKNRSSRSGGLARRLRQVCTPPSLVHIGDRDKITRFISSLGSQALVIDIGSGSKRRGKNVVNLDISAYPQVDIVFDGYELPIQDNIANGVVSTAVLEHVQDPAKYVSEILRILEPGSQCLITVPFIMGYHNAPSDFRRYTLAGLEALFSEFEKIESGVEAGPSSALAWVMQEWIGMFACSVRGYRMLKLIAGWVLQPLRYFDVILAKRPLAHKIAAGLYFVGRKPKHKNNG